MTFHRRAPHRSSPRRRLSRPALVLAAVLVVAGGSAVGATALSSDSGSTGTGGTPAERENPLAGMTFHVDPAGHAPQQLRAWDAVGDERATWLRRLAAVPTATWFAGGEQDLTGRATQVTTDAASAGEVPVLVAYNVPGRDCGLYSSGGAADDAAYLDWVRGLAAGIGPRPAVVVLEPDAVTHALDPACGASEEDSRARFALLRQAVEVLGAGGATRVYLDAGNPGWVQDRAALADALEAAGVHEADGFALNVSNFRTTADNETYGRELSARLDGAHFVVDTSRNGSGPAPDDGSGLTWCNPQGRSVGAVPTTDTADPLVDAYLWVKVPGDSDGACRPGEPAAGSWWPDYALDLVMETMMGHPYTGH